MKPVAGAFYWSMRRHVSQVAEGVTVLRFEGASAEGATARKTKFEEAPPPYW